MNRFSDYSADKACKEMYTICNTHSPTQKRKRIAKSVHVTIGALQPKLAKKDGKEKEFLD